MAKAVRQIARPALAAVLLLLCLLLAADWIKSLWRTDECVIWIKGVDRWMVQDYSGRLFLFSTPEGWSYVLNSDRDPNPPRYRLMWIHYPVTANFTPGDATWRYAGFHYSVFRDNPSSSIASYGYAVPHWFLILLLGAAGWWAGRSWLLARRHRRRLAEGLCVVCGYDLRASPDRCPECGTPRA